MNADPNDTGNSKIGTSAEKIYWWHLSARYRRFCRSKAREKVLRRRSNRVKKDAMGDSPRSVSPISTFITDDSDRIEAFARYYDYARREIQREDDITASRLHTTLTFQGFLLGATVLIFSALTTLASKPIQPLDSGKIAEHSPINEVILFSGFAIQITIAVAGLVISYYSYQGIKSSRKSLHWAKDMWIDFNKKNGSLYPSLFPQLTKYSMLREKVRHRTDQGTDFALAIPSVLICFWLVLALTWITLLVLSAHFIQVPHASALPHFPLDPLAV